MNILKRLIKIKAKCKKDKSHKMSTDFVVWNVMVKFVSFLPAYLLNKKKISPDIITLISFIFIPLGSYLIINDQVIYGSSCWIIFGILDSIDGDMVRLSNKKNFYGEILDSFGADIFYFFCPVTVGYYLFKNSSYFEIYFDPNNMLIISFLTTFFIIFTRYMGSKRFILSLIDPQRNSKFYKNKNNNRLKKIKSNVSFLEHVIIRKNFFAEPGMILNFFILFNVGNLKYLEYYLLIIFVYFIFIFVKRVLGSIIYFHKV